MDTDELMDLASGYWKSAALSAAVEGGVFEALAGGALSAAQAAERTGASPPHLEGLLDALAGMGVVEKGEGTYRPAPALAHRLDPAHPDNLLAALRFNTDLYNLWGRLPTSIREGRPIIPQNEHLGDNPAQMERFVRGMHSRGRLFGPPIIEALAGIENGRLLDIAAGAGTFSVQLAEAHPGLAVTLFDLPPVLAVAGEIHADSPARDRLTFLPGDYHREPLPRADAVLYCGALHQEPEREAAAVFAKICGALEPGGTCLVIDFMLEPCRTRPVFSALFELNMMLMRSTFHVYSRDEVERLIGEAGFVEPRTTPIARTPYWLTTAVKPS